MGVKNAHYFCGIIFVTIRFHIPDDLMAKELGNFGCLKDKLGNIAYNSVSLYCLTDRMNTPSVS